ncbi:serine hydrolase domain-containing protein [Marinoscillum furvescens]|uniref:CubicO group peptidase (Beta-lactamase class C family) n=1 Tax=Marinoscillum furvescens DSM 4134 TaxID=1122208 RepID=A0A3D9L380_MARFU|nr:serine hydrolase domain-containing protein [Marinoscillum furvescens]RED97441.1 CubicO group peptidase (beta-lactamase class C family) [Marinoscillum furvescens DSM 4134]
MKNLAVISMLVCITACYTGEEISDLDPIWEYASPESVNFQSETLYELDKAISEKVYNDITGVLMVKDQQLFFENYYGDHTRHTLRPIGNATYGVIILALDFFITEGLCSLDDPIYTHLPEYTDIFDENPDKRKITIRHLLENKSGLAWAEPSVYAPGNSSDISSMKRTTDWPGYVLRQPLEAQPGLRTVPNSGTAMVVAKILQNLLIDRDLTDYISERLLHPLGIQHFEWEKSHSGLLNASDGLYLSTLDYTRIGFLVLNEGRWLNKQRIISRDWALEVVTPARLTNQYYGNGLGWKVFSDQFIEENTQSSQKIYFQTSISGYSLYLVPDQQLVVGITSSNLFYHDVFNPSLYLFLRTLQSTYSPQAN